MIAVTLANNTAAAYSPTFSLPDKNADWNRAKDIFCYFAQVSLGTDPYNHAINKQTLGLRIWEKICDYRGTPSNKRPPLDFSVQVDVNDLKNVAKQFGTGFGFMGDKEFRWRKEYHNDRLYFGTDSIVLVQPDEKISLNHYVNFILDAMSNGKSTSNGDIAVSFPDFVDYMAHYDDPNDNLFRSLRV